MFIIVSRYNYNSIFFFLLQALIKTSPDLIEQLRQKKEGPCLLKSLREWTIKKPYSPEIKTFALALSFFSTRAYNFVRTEFNDVLPHVNTIRKWHQKVDGSPGFTLSAIPIIRRKIGEAKEKGKTLSFCLIMDEMYICKDIQSNQATGQVFGYEALGQVAEDGKEYKNVATQALVYMISCVNDRWKMPVSYFFIKGMNTEEKTNVTLEVIELLFHIT